MIKTHAFLPTKAHVSQNPVFVVVEVNLASWREESMSQFSCDAVETMVQVGLQTVRVVDGVEACQDRERETYLRAEEGNPHSIISLCLDNSGEWGGGGGTKHRALSSAFTPQDDNHSSHCHWEYTQEPGVYTHRDR